MNPGTMNANSTSSPPSSPRKPQRRFAIREMKTACLERSKPRCIDKPPAGSNGELYFRGETSHYNARTKYTTFGVEAGPEIQCGRCSGRRHGFISCETGDMGAGGGGRLSRSGGASERAGASEYLRTRSSLTGRRGFVEFATPIKQRSSGSRDKDAKSARSSIGRRMVP
jgi:hypothetical protein